MTLPVSAGLAWGLLVAFLLVCLLAAASYMKAASLAPGAIPLWLCSREPGDQAYFHNVLQAVEKKADGSLRFCTKCGAFKPDRTHHCPQLGQCVLVLQHWSVWCNNAVGFYNYKCYLLALLYAGLAHGAGAAMLLPAVVRSIRDAVEEGKTPPALEGLLRGGPGSVQALPPPSCVGALQARRADPHRPHHPHHPHHPHRLTSAGLRAAQRRRQLHARAGCAVLASLPRLHGGTGRHRR